MMNLTMQLADVDLADVGAWPAALRAAAVVAAALATLAAGYWLFVAERRAELAAAEARAENARGELNRKREQAAAQPRVRDERDAAAAAFAALLHRLPARTEVPALIEDLTRSAVANDLAVSRIDLAEERQADLYAELPIEIEVSGGYHRLGAFAAAMAGLPRLVTQHDFAVLPGDGAGDLTLTLAAKTYRYLDGQRERDR